MTDELLFNYSVRLGDHALVVAQRLGEWVGHGPELEEELANANFALDYIGQARMFLSYAGEIEDEGRSEDDLAFGRDGWDFHNVLLVEQPNNDFGYTIVRQFLFESFYQLQLDALSQSTDSRLAEIAARAVKELRYHLRHGRQWLVRLFEADEIDRQIAELGIGPSLSDLRERWDQDVTAALTEATLTRPGEQWMATGGKQGRHSEHLGYMLADMQFLQRAYPGATW